MLLPSVERCLHGVRTRLDHVFADEDATRKMHHEFSNAGIDGRHVVVDPPDRADEVAEVILSKRDRGELAYDVTT